MMSFRGRRKREERKKTQNKSTLTKLSFFSRSRSMSTTLEKRSFAPTL